MFTNLNSTFLNKTNKLFNPNLTENYHNEFNTYIFLTLSLGMCLFVVLVLIYRFIQCCRFLSNNVFYVGVARVYLLPKRVYREDADDENTTCKLCSEECKNGDLIRDLPCRHSFHSNCIVNHVRDNHTQRCPLCLEHIYVKNNKNQNLRVDVINNKPTPSYGALLVK